MYILVFKCWTLFFRILLATSTGMMGVVAISHHTLQINVSSFLNNLLVLLNKGCFICLTKIFCKVVPSLNVALLRERERERERETESEISVEKNINRCKYVCVWVSEWICEYGLKKLESLRNYCYVPTQLFLALYMCVFIFGFPCGYF